MRPILIVGASGQVGRELMTLGKAEGGTLVGATRQELDIRDDENVRAVIARTSPAVVINAAAYTNVDKAESERALAFSVNRDGAANLAAACAALSVPLLHISTDYVFDGRKTGAYLEGDPTSPLGVYGASKLAGEEILRERLEEHVILRTSWVFSSHGANFVKTILRLATERTELRVVDDQHGCPTPAGAIARALLAIAARIRNGQVPWGTYHFCGMPATTWCAFARAIVDAPAAHLGDRVRITAITTAEYPTAARRPANSVMSCAEIEAAFGLRQPDWRASLPGVVAAVLGKGCTQ